MFVQYIAGPEYAVCPAVLFPHLAMFVLAGALLVVAWSNAQVPPISSPRRWATVLGLFALFVLSRYVDACVGTFTGAAVPESYSGDLGMFWTVVLLDLGVVVPVAIATVAALLRGAAWADRALYGVLGWFALVPPAVATMALVKLVVGDPHGTVPLLIVLGSAAAVSLTVGIVRHRALFAPLADRR